MTVDVSSTTDVDRISELPSILIDNILMRLPQKEAIRTSILSSNWRYKWITLTQLVFDYPSGYILEDSEKTKLIIAVYRAFLIRHGPLFKFSFSASDMGNSPDINHWIRFLNKTDIHDFTLRIWKGEPHKLPAHFYSFGHLRHLSLYNCVFRPPPTFKVLDVLVSLEFRKVVFAAERFGIFLSQCPQLEILTLEDCPHFFCLRITAPKLKYFSFSGAFDSIQFQNSPLLEVVSVDLNGLPERVRYFKDRRACNLIDIISNVPAVEVLIIEGHFFEFLSIGNMQKRLPRNLEFLKVIHLADVCFRKIEEVSCAVCLIRSSPNLEELTLQATIKLDAPMEPCAEYYKVEDYPDCSLNRLREVRVQHISCVQPELEFLKFLLATSSMLEKMEILPTIESVNRGFQILRELVRFRRASAKAEIVYLDPDIDDFSY